MVARWDELSVDVDSAGGDRFGWKRVVGSIVGEVASEEEVECSLGDATFLSFVGDDGLLWVQGSVGGWSANDVSVQARAWHEARTRWVGNAACGRVGRRAWVRVHAQPRCGLACMDGLHIPGGGKLAVVIGSFLPSIFCFAFRVGTALCILL